MMLACCLFSGCSLLLKFLPSVLTEVILIYQYPFHISPLLGNLCQFIQSKICLSTCVPIESKHITAFITVYLCRILHLAWKCLSINLSGGLEIAVCRRSSAHCLFCKWCLMGTHPCLFHYTSFKAAFALWQRREVVLTGMNGSQSLKYSVWFFSLANSKWRYMKLGTNYILTLSWFI